MLDTDRFRFNGRETALLKALTGQPPPLDDRSWKVIEHAPRHFRLWDIANIIVEAAEAALWCGEPPEEVRRTLEKRVENLCWCFSDEIAAEFRGFIADELNVRSRSRR